MSMVIPEHTARKYEQYPEYKDSGVEWLGEIPAHWEAKRLKYSVNLINDKVETGTIDLPYIGLENVESWTGRLVEYEDRIEPESTSNRFQLKDILFGKLRPYLAKVVHAEQDGICSSELIVLRPLKRCCPRFLFYYLLSRDTIGIVNSATYGVKMPRANWQFIGNLAFPAFEMDEQQAIADFLDQETSTIDELIARKQRLLDLLQEQRTALITHTVTKGLNPDAPMKDSGVEWLGEIPAHWEIKKLKYTSLVRFSSVDKHSKEDEQPVHLCNYTDVYNKDTILPTEEFMEATATKNEIALFSLKKEDVIVTKDSEDWKDIAVPGYVAVNLPDVICGYHLALIRPDSLVITGKYLFWSFCARNLNHQFTIAATGITRFGLGKYWLDASLFLIPPIQEQQAMADYLDQETTRIDSLVGRINQAIEKLQEYRSALITAAVTGKIDVRQHVS